VFKSIEKFRNDSSFNFWVMFILGKIQVGTSLSLPIYTSKALPLLCKCAEILRGAWAARVESHWRRGELDIPTHKNN
jgi:hypothetical protein